MKHRWRLRVERGQLTCCELISGSFWGSFPEEYTPFHTPMGGINCMLVWAEDELDAMKKTLLWMQENCDVASIGYEPRRDIKHGNT